MAEWTLGIIGCGNMGSAIARGIRSMVLNGEISLFLSDKDAGKASALARDMDSSVEEPHQVVKVSDIVIIAVKPQDAALLFEGISEHISDNTIVSIMAGVKMSTLTGFIGKDVPMARVMPNMGAVVDESMTCIAYNTLLKDRTRIENIFNTIGKTAVVDEDAMDAVTAVSGSGPAYFLYMLEAMIEAGKELGFDDLTARELAVQTFYGAAKVIRENDDICPDKLISSITSKGGTTEAALSVFSENKVDSIIKNAVYKAKLRSEELS